MAESRAIVLQGTLDLLILKALSAGELHGLGVSRRIEQITRGTFSVQPGSLFPALHRLEEAGAFQGRIEVFGAPALLQMCGQGGLTGIFTSIAEDAQHTATVMGFREGHVVSATCGTLAGPEAVYAFLAWTRGSFKFAPGDPGSGEPLAQSVEHLLLEGCRLLDESQLGSPPGGAPAS